MVQLRIIRLNNVEAGMYFVTIQSERFEKTEKIIVR
ncbi:MAG: T9SS type A sorting domain-containing protein [Flavobacteriales bacterium]|nr:T9SS type A sorting domain-containing protein [Flavobacteriales bacterium]